MKKRNLTLIIIAAIGVLLLIILFVWSNNVYNQAIDYQEKVESTWGDVQTSYQRRADLIPNLVATVKGAAENEKEILVKVTEARSGIVKAKSPKDMELLGKEINTAINLAFEAYPQIRSTENFTALQAQLEGTENRIAVSRIKYNEAVQKYNRHIRGKFRKMVLNIYETEEDNFVRRELFEAQSGADVAPQVQF